MVKAFPQAVWKASGSILLQRIVQHQGSRFIENEKSFVHVKSAEENGILPLYGNSGMAGQSAEKSEIRWYHGLMFALSVCLGCFFMRRPIQWSRAASRGSNLPYSIARQNLNAVKRM